jgi:integrase
VSKAPAPYLKRGPSGIWSIHWTESGAPGHRGRSKRESTGQSESTAAQVYFGEWLLLRQNGGPVPAEQVFTIEDLWKVYDTKHVQRKVVASERLDFAWAAMKPYFGALVLSDLTHDRIYDYTTKRQTGKLGRKVKPSTVRKELGALTACLNWCADPGRRLIDKAAVPRIELPPHGEPSDRWLTMHEIKKLFAAAAEMRRGDDKEMMTRGERFLWLALETGARKTAICQLTWDRVDFETGVIHYDVPGRVTTKKRRASVPISKALRLALERVRTERQPARDDLESFRFRLKRIRSFGCRQHIRLTRRSAGCA